MSDRRRFLVLFAMLAAAAAVVFLAISIDRHVYAPGARVIGSELGKHHRLDRIADRLPPLAQKALDPVRFLRKLYSVGAFAIVGFFAAPLLPRVVRLRGDAALIAGFSLTIEIVQRLTGSHETLDSSLFDVGCGVVGGFSGAVAWNAVTAALRRSRSPGA